MGRRLKNPSPVVVVGTIAALGLVGYAGYEALGKSKFTKKKKKEPGTIDCPDGTVLDAETGVCVAKKQPPPTPADDWGTGMTASTSALNEGVPVKLFKDDKGLWNFGYSWKQRKRGNGSGVLWDWLRGGEEGDGVDTIIVMSEAETPATAYTLAGDWMRRLHTFVTQFALKTDMPPGFLYTQALGHRLRNEKRWGVVGRAQERVAGWPLSMRIIQVPWGGSGDGPYWYAEKWDGGWTGGCCMTLNEANENIADV